MKNSLKEISNKIEEFCKLTGLQYRMDDYSNFISSNNKYPIIWATPTRFRVQAGQVQMIINVAVMNILYDKNDMVKMLSDLLDIVTQLFTYFDDNSQNDTYFVQQIQASEATPFFVGVDNVCGIQADFVFNVMFDSEQGRIQTL
jgi:hypothetical protein